jgi:transposase-like protein
LAGKSSREWLMLKRTIPNILILYLFTASGFASADEASAQRALAELKQGNLKPRSNATAFWPKPKNCSRTTTTSWRSTRWQMPRTSRQIERLSSRRNGAGS